MIVPISIPKGSKKGQCATLERMRELYREDSRTIGYETSRKLSGIS